MGFNVTDPLLLQQVVGLVSGIVQNLAGRLASLRDAGRDDRLGGKPIGIEIAVAFRISIDSV